MDQRDPYDGDRLNSISLDNDNNDQSQVDLWDDEEEEIELGSDEAELFLRDEYTKPKRNDILPFRVSNPSQTIMYNQQIQRNGFTKQAGRPRGSRSPSEPSGSETKIETFQVDDSGRGSPSSSVIYQMPNYDQFAVNLAPNSSNSVILSFVIIFVILTVTIVPKVIPQSQSPYAYDGLEDYDDDIIEDNSILDAGFSREYTRQSVHSDARCKCICPPLFSSSPGTSDASSTTKSLNSMSSNGTRNLSPTNNSQNSTTTISNSKTANQRRLYVGNTLPDQCNCNNIVRAHFQTDTKVSFKEFCARCECRYQSRNTTTIKRIVIFFIAVLVGLTLYLLVQYVLKHFRITRRSLPPNFRWLNHQMVESN